MSHPFDINEESLRSQSIDEFIRSIARIENAFANVLNSEMEFLNRNRDRFSPEQLLEFNENLENIIKLAIKKEIILELLLEEVKKCPKHCKREKECKCHCKSHHCHCNDCCDCEHDEWEDEGCFHCHEPEFICECFRKNRRKKYY